MLTALLTGVTGQDCGYLAEQLASARHSVHGVVGHDADPRSLFEHLAALGDAPTVHPADLRNLDALTVLIDEVAPDWLFNLAGISSVATIWDEPIVPLDVNAGPVGRHAETPAPPSGRRRPPPALSRRPARRSPRAPFRTGPSPDLPLPGLHCSSLILFNHE
jgi:GDPmannose 4,6-dehydratase